MEEPMGRLALARIRVQVKCLWQRVFSNKPLKCLGSGSPGPLWSTAAPLYPEWHGLSLAVQASLGCIFHDTAHPVFCPPLCFFLHSQSQKQNCEVINYLSTEVPHCTFQ